MNRPYTPVPLEAQVKKTCLDFLQNLRARDKTLAFRKRHGSAAVLSGDPDLHGVWRGVPFDFELKRPGESPTLLQASRLAEWDAAGSVTAVVRSLEDLLDALELVKKRQPPEEAGFNPMPKIRIPEG